ncbi:hypothetical protein, partial [Bacillus sp. 18-5]|uniref:hypothetical protein n=1 Tax=Bacillus sp. 18-5 TaxID=3458701 RepID=UPI004045674B
NQKACQSLRLRLFTTLFDKTASHTTRANADQSSLVSPQECLAVEPMLNIPGATVTLPKGKSALVANAMPAALLSCVYPQLSVLPVKREN